MGYTDNNMDWNKVYYCSEKVYEKYCEYNKKIYGSIKKEDYQTLDKCIEYAIEQGNHVAFVHFFLEKGKTRSKIFSDKLSEYIEEYTSSIRDKKEIKPRWNEFKIVSSVYWRSSDFQYNCENLDKHSYKKTMLWRWQDEILNIIPDRDAIVQCAFYFGMNVERTNEFLIAAGHEKLYILDIVDAVSIFYLNKFYKEESKKTPFEKLEEVKGKINSFLTQYLDTSMVNIRNFKQSKVIQNKLSDEEEETIGVLEPEWNEDGTILYFNKQVDAIEDKIKEKYGIEEAGNSGENIYFRMPNSPQNAGQIRTYLQWIKRKNVLYRYERKDLIKRLGERNALGWEIEDEIKNYKKIFEENPVKQDEERITEYLTKLFTTKISESATIDDFIEKGIINKEEYSGVFAQKYYEYLRRTVKYLESPEKYIKNIQYSAWTFEKGKPILVSELEEKNGFLSDYCMRFAEKIKREETFRNPRTAYLHVVNEIWNCSKKTGYVGDVEPKGGKRFKVRTLIEGENRLNGYAYQAEGDRFNEREEIKEAYVLNLGNKVNLMKYAIATGNEDEIGIYLQYPGFWNSDLYGDEKFGNEDMYLADRTDCLLVYALRYRDKLLDEWEKNETVDKPEYRKKIKKEFPFIKLLQIINRDIQFVNKHIEPKKEVSKSELIYFVEE